MKSTFLSALAAAAVAALLMGAGCETGPTAVELPVADAGPDVSSEDPLAEIVLDGSASTSPDGGSLTYHWRFDTQPSASVLTVEDILNNDSSEPTARFTPDVAGTYGLTLQVDSATASSDLDYLRVQVGVANQPPVAEAGDNVTSATGVNTSVDGSGSFDPEGNFLQYRWTIVLKPEDSELTDASIFNQGTPNALIIPDALGIYILSLEVNDGEVWSDPDYVTITVADGNQPPVAAAGDSQFLTPCSPTEILLDGSASFDPEGAELQYAWSFTLLPEGSALTEAVMVGRYEALASFNWDVVGTYVMELRVNDGEQWSEPSYVAVEAVPHEPNNPPVAVAPQDITVSVNAICTSSSYTISCAPCGAREIELLDESFDPDRDDLNRTWSVVSGAASVLDPSSPVGIASLPEQTTEPGRTASNEYVVQLAVNDCQTAAFDTVTITYECTGVTP